MCMYVCMQSSLYFHSFKILKEASSFKRVLVLIYVTTVLFKARGGVWVKILDFLCFYICLSPGNGGSESFYRIEKSFFVPENEHVKVGSYAQNMANFYRKIAKNLKN